MIEKKQINILMHEIKYHEKIVERLKEHPHYINYNEIKAVTENGMFIQQTIDNELNSIDELKKQTNEMIKEFKQQSIPDENGVNTQTINPKNTNGQQSFENEKPHPQKSNEEIARDSYQNAESDIGIDEDIEGMPDIDDLPDFEED